MKKCEFKLEPYAVPKVEVVSAVVEQGFTLSGNFYDPSDDWDNDWKDGEDYDW